jgi:hypothetical protein
MQGSRITKNPSTLMKQLILISFIFLCFDLLARQIEETTFSYWDKPDAQIYYSKPDSIDCKYENYFYYAWSLKNSRAILN